MEKKFFLFDKIRLFKIFYQKSYLEKIPETCADLSEFFFQTLQNNPSFFSKKGFF